MHSGHAQETNTNTKARMMMNTKVAKIIRSLMPPAITFSTLSPPLAAAHAYRRKSSSLSVLRWPEMAALLTSERVFSNV